MDDQHPESRVRPQESGEYGAVEMPIGWSRLSLVVFGLSLVINLIVIYHVTESTFRNLVCTTCALAPLGLLCALVGWRSGDPTWEAKLATFLNGATVVVLLAFTLLPITYRYVVNALLAIVAAGQLWVWWKFLRS